MITLATLNEASLQEIFDQVVNHLLIQNEQAMGSNGICRYRTEDGLKCAVGCLISDDEYDPKMDSGVLTLDAVVHQLGDKYKLLFCLQHIHDLNEPEQWPSALKKLATKFNLEYNHDNTGNA